MNMQRWNRRAFLQAIGVLSLVGPSILLTGCQYEKKQSKAGQAPPPSEAKGEAKVHTVQMVSDGKSHFFDPDRLRIQVADTVTWILKSGVHTTTAYHPDYFDKPLRIPERAEPWHSGVLKEIGQSFTQKFEIEGVYNYYCTPHQSLGMIGIVVVGKPVEGPGLAPPQEMLMYEREREKLAELVTWAKKLSS